MIMQIFFTYDRDTYERLSVTYYELMHYQLNNGNMIYII